MTKSKVGQGIPKCQIPRGRPRFSGINFTSINFTSINFDFPRQPGLVTQSVNMSETFFQTRAESFFCDFPSDSLLKAPGTEGAQVLFVYECSSANVDL